jgi:pimeloyl-ACP methyl ester carboxylesterase
MKYILACWLALLALGTTRAQQFKVAYAPSAYTGPFTGNVLLYLSQKNAQPKDHAGWPCYRLPMQGVRPGQAIVFSDAAISYPTLLSRLPRGEYYVQAVWDLNHGQARVIGQSPGNPYSVARKITLAAPTDTFTLTCDQVVAAPVFVASTFCKEMKVPSAKLSKFLHQPTTLNAAVILPADYHRHPSRRYPVLFTIGGFTASYLHYSRSVSTDTLPATPIDTIACIRVYLDGECALGHSVYANSANNGPVGDAFTTEFLPYLDRHYRTNGGRVLRGHSSGGYAVAYLLMHYPELFAGGNASSPDPVDFHSFVGTNLYTATQRTPFTDSVSMEQKPPVGVVFDRPNIAHSFEEVIYRGEQDASFDAVFSPRGPQGQPQPLFDSHTGALDRAVFAHWQRYDLTQYVHQHWASLKPDLAGKLRISVGNEDTYFLNQPVQLMEQQLKALGADIPVAYFPGTHFTVFTPAYKKAETEWLKKTYLAWLAKHPLAAQ